MLGAIIGDRVGTEYEYLEFLDAKNGIINVERRKEILTKKELITDKGTFSDDTVLTIAVLEAIIYNKPYMETLRKYGMEYVDKKVPKEDFFESWFSPLFATWIKAKEGTIGHSMGNGAAMRVSPVAFLYRSLAKVEEEAKKSAIPSHNTKEAIEATKCLAGSIYLARRYGDKERVKEYVKEYYGYNLDYNLDELREYNLFNSFAEYTVPQAISIFLQSEGFEDAIRKAVSIGGDTDTIASMVGALAEAYYGVPNNLREQILSLLPTEFKDLILKAYQIINFFEGDVT